MTMSRKPQFVYFSYLDSAPPLTPAMAQRFLKEAFSECGNAHTELLAKSIIERIKMIQENMIAGKVDYAKIWHLFETDEEIIFIEEVFACNPPGFAMIMSMPWLKKKLHKQLRPIPNLCNAHAGPRSELILDQMDAIINHMNG
jgi:hypothetical protein